MTTACPRAPLDEKNRGKKQQTDPRDEDKKDQEREATQTLYEYTKCIYFGLKLKRFSNRIHLRIVKFKNLLKPVNCTFYLITWKINLSEILNISVTLGKYPSKLKLSKITPIFKSGEDNDANKLQTYILI